MCFLFIELINMYFELLLVLIFIIKNIGRFYSHSQKLPRFPGHYNTIVVTDNLQKERLILAHSYTCWWAGSIAEQHSGRIWVKESCSSVSRTERGKGQTQRKMYPARPCLLHAGLPPSISKSTAVPRYPFILWNPCLWACEALEARSEGRSGEVEERRGRRCKEE